MPETLKSGESCLALIVDDEESIRKTLADVFDDEGWQSVTAENGKVGLQLYSRRQPDLVLLDVWMPGMDGIETLQMMRQLNPKIPIVIMSGHGTIETAVRATKLGAFDYLEKPLSLDKLIPLLDHARQIRLQQDEKSRHSTVPDMIGNSPLISQIKRQINMVAPRNAWILITGENGTGKEVVARHIHEKSSRATKPFVAVNCAAIPEELIESELFGHTKGAFTNAISQKKGKFELAHQGTLFLDEIGDMSLRTQAKILRILQEQAFERVGSTETLTVDVRVVAATNKDLKEQIKTGQFREDLYYRLNVVPFHLPPLRDRGEDIFDLTQHFLFKMAQELSEKQKILTPEAQKVMREYPWPGNIRELKNLLERACIMSDAELIEADFLRDLLGSSEKIEDPLSQEFLAASTLKQAKTDFERAYIIGKLEENQWNITKTADAIGLERSNLHRKMKLYGIEPKAKG
ncbi:MAG TPA: sigma-54 dependent transcriptional regulator [Oligoflexus sp.]|uniref:sigma-54-dependent transcriptional regulator n=1 Tax=Oligoflexus sp. TaxID=1971216 RepID=UPI002D4D7F1B|nr:sigma-54 dependent transcriptional regulator [Oligoflexus sp.]HYX36955.1 sigma-54 dependent transcriptional regulator [Oligoflexus sp.]